MQDSREEYVAIGRTQAQGVLKSVEMLIVYQIIKFLINIDIMYYNVI